MLLRRITEHVKAQNWTAVALDFVIVVAGILIAFQITNWSEARRDRAQERQIIERLYTDFVALSTDLEEDIEFLSSVGEALDDFREMIVSYPQGVDIERLRAFFDTAFNLPPPAGQSDTYEQLVASGDMTLISNNQLRTAIVAHAKLTENFRQRDQAVREWSRPYLEPVVRLSHLIETLPAEDAFVSAGSKADLIVAVRMYYDIYTGQLVAHEEHRESFTEIIDMLAAEKKK